MRLLELKFVQILGLRTEFSRISKRQVEKQIFQKFVISDEYM